jgi:hypothetical protein
MCLQTAIKKKFWEELIAYLPFTIYYESDKTPKLHITHCVQQFPHYCACIRCRGNLFAEPLPRNVMGDAQKHRQRDDLIGILLFSENKVSRLKIYS